MKDKIKGTVVFIFQPAEEGPPAGEEGGAPLMVKEGVMDNPKIDAIFGIHINLSTEIGTIKIQIRCDNGGERLVQDQGQGQTDARCVSVARHRPDRRRDADLHRFADDRCPSVGTDESTGRHHRRTINGGVRENIIPEELTMAGTIRTLDFRDAEGRSRKDPPDRKRSPRAWARPPRSRSTTRRRSPTTRPTGQKDAAFARKGGRKGKCV